MSGRNRRCEFSKRGGGFTLIELLVVISIISMLMSIMLPSLGRAREMGQRVVCQSNMRQLGIGWYTYSLENDDSFCSPNTEFNNFGGVDYHWVADGPYDAGNTIGGTEEAIKDGILSLYLSNTVGVYKCKSDKTELLRSYSISNAMGGYNCGCGNMTTPYTSWSQINEPSSRLVFIDADSTEPAGEPKWIAGGFWCLSDIDPAIARWAIPRYNNITARHSGGTNVAYADMHCGYRKWRDQRTLAIANWDFSSSNLDGDNKDLEFFLEVLKGPMD